MYVCICIYIFCHNVCIITLNYLWFTWIAFYQVVKIDGRIIGDGQVGPVTRRLQRAYIELTEASGVAIPTYHQT